MSMKGRVFQAREGFTRKTFATSIVLAMLVAALFTLAPGAAADVTFGEQGSGAGETSLPRAVAVDRSDGTVYVADWGNSRVVVFDAAGNFIRAFGWGVADGTTAALQVCTSTCFKGISGGGAGQFDPGEPGDLNAIAVDNDPTSPSYQDVFVGTERVQRFDPDGSFVLSFKTGSGPTNAGAASDIDAGLDGTIFAAVNANRVKKFTTSGVLTSDFNLSPPDLSANVNGIATDSSGNFYIAGGNVTGAVRKYDSGGTLLNTLNPSLNILDIAVDEADNLYVADTQQAYHTPFSPRAIFEYSSSGTLLRVFYGDVARRLVSLAPYSNPSGDVFATAEIPAAVAETEAVVHIPLPSPGPVVAPVTNADPIGNLKATLNGAVNPANEATSSHFEYVDQATFEAEGFAGAISTPEKPVGSDFELYKVSAEISGLEPSTTYRFRVVATNATSSDIGEEVTFTTRPPFEIGAAWSSAVDSSSAILHAEANPFGIPASGYFEYVDDATFQVSGFTEATEVPTVSGGATSLAFGTGEEPEEVSVALSSLESDMLYHYRIVVENSFVTEAGPERMFRTFPLGSHPNTSCPNQAFRFGAASVLPDCRAYEMVSPVEKNGGDISPVDFAVGQATADGERVTFASQAAFAGSAAAKLLNQYLASRDSQSGWSTGAIAPPSGSTALYATGAEATTVQFKAFTGDLCQGWFLQGFDTALTPDAPTQVPNVYRRANCTDGSYALLTRVAPPGHGMAPETFSEYFPTIQGFSKDGSRSLLRANAKLTPNAVAGTQATQLYEYYDGGKLRLVSVLPNGNAFNGYASAGTANKATRFNPVTYREDNVWGAVSADASRVFWTAAPDFIGGPGELYLRLNATEAPSKLSEGECTEPAKACTIEVSTGDESRFWGADPDATRAIYVEGDNLFEFDVASRTRHLIASRLRGVIGTNEDATRVYFASDEILDEGGAAGKPNLYLYDTRAGGSYAFIGTLSKLDVVLDEQSNSVATPVSIQPRGRLSRVSPDGGHVIFSSDAELTGYDNRDTHNGKSDDEIYRYDAAVDELLCVSCDPSGARPLGRLTEPPTQGVELHWAAATIPGWSSQFQPSRALSNDGSRVFFNSFGPLVPTDTNGRADVYQWEEPGSGDCTTASLSYFVANGGCLTLISSGKSSSDSEFFDATADGSTVFFGTSSSLLPQDTGLFDLYAARVEGGFPPPPPPAVPCLGDACQSPAPAPNEQTPASATFKGPGNPRTAGNPRRRCPKGKRRVVRRGKSRCLTRKRDAKKPSRRANHDRRTAR